MNRTKREELERACREEKDRKVRNRMLAVRMVLVHNLSVEETTDYLMQCPNWVRNWLRRYDEGGPDGLRDLPRSGRPRRIPSDTVDGIVARVAGSGITPKGLQRIMHEETGVKLHITYVRKIMRAACRPRRRRGSTPTGQAKEPCKTGSTGSTSGSRA